MLASLDALQAHASEHFALEDQELRQMRDGNASCHLDEHAAVLKSMDEVRGIVAAGPDSTESAHLVARLTAELRRWLPEHVTAMGCRRRAYPHPQSPGWGAGGAHSPVFASGLIGATSPRIPRDRRKTLSGRRPARITVWTCPHRPAGPARRVCPWQADGRFAADLPLEDYPSTMLLRLAQAIQQQVSATYARAHGLSVAEWRMLARLNSEGSVQLATLCRALAMDKAYAGGCCAPSAHSRWSRSKPIRPTAAG